MVGLARQTVERGTRDRLVNGHEASHRPSVVADYGNRWRAAARSGAGAVVARAVIRRSGLIGSVIVFSLCRRSNVDRVSRRRRDIPAVRRTMHDPLRPAHEERKPEREREPYDATTQRSVHSAD